MGDERGNRLWRESYSDATEAITILTGVVVTPSIALDEEAQAKGKV